MPINCSLMRLRLQVVYPKYEEALRLGLAAFSNPMRTNKFRRQLPHILGTLEFQRCPNPSVSPMPAIKATGPTGSRNGEAPLLDSPGTGATIGTGSSDFTQKAQDLIDSFPLPSELNNGGSSKEGSKTERTASASFGSSNSAVEAASEDVDEKTHILTGCRAEGSETECEQTRKGAAAAVVSREGLHNQSEEVVSPGGGTFEHHATLSQCHSATLSEGAMWHSASSGSPGSVGCAPECRGVAERMPMEGKQQEDMVAKDTGVAATEEMSGHEQITTDGRNVEGTPAMVAKGDSDELMESLSFADQGKGASLEVPASLPANLEGGLFDDVDFSAELERLRASKGSSLVSASQRPSNHGQPVGPAQLVTVGKTDGGFNAASQQLGRPQEVAVSTPVQSGNSAKEPPGSVQLKNDKPEDTEIVNRVYSELLQWQLK